MALSWLKIIEEQLLSAFAFLTFHKSVQIINLCKFEEKKKMAKYFPEESDFGLIHLNSKRSFRMIFSMLKELYVLSHGFPSGRLRKHQNTSIKFLKSQEGFTDSHHLFLISTLFPHQLFSGFL